METTNNIGNPNDSIIDLVGHEDKRRTRCRAEEEIMKTDDIRSGKQTKSKGTGTEGTRSGSPSDRHVVRIVEGDEDDMMDAGREGSNQDPSIAPSNRTKSDGTQEVDMNDVDGREETV